MYGNPAFTQQVGLGCRGWVAAHVDRGQPLCFQGLSQIQSGWFCWVIAAVSAGSKKNQPKVRSWIWPDKVRIGWLDNQSWFSLWVDGGKRSVSLPKTSLSRKDRRHERTATLMWPHQALWQEMFKTEMRFYSPWLKKDRCHLCKSFGYTGSKWQPQQVLIQILRFWECL